jgi:hypothetical protein
MKTRFLNPAVEREVRADPTLFVAWGLTIDTVDDEIEPTFNPTWVQHRQERERDHLAKLKGEIAALLGLMKSEAVTP